MRLISVSKSKKERTPRQKFLSALMSRVSGDSGEKLAALFVAGKSDELEAAMAEVGKQLADQSEGK